MIADIIVVGIVTFFIYKGYRTGLAKTIVKSVSYLVSIAVSIIFYPVFSKFLMGTAIYTKLTEFIDKNYVSKMVDSSGNTAFGVISKYLAIDPVSATDGMAGAIAGLIINILAFIVFLILVKWIIKIITKATNVFNKIPIIKHFNRGGGMLLGGLIGILIVYIICAVLFVLTPFAENGGIAKIMDESIFAVSFFENNLILNLIGKGN